MSTDGVKTDEQGKRYIEVEMKWDDTGKTEERRVYEGKCSVCETIDFLVPEVEMCGPCCFGEASTAGGNW